MSHEGIRFVDKEHAVRETEENRPLPRIAITPDKVRVMLTRAGVRDRLTGRASQRVDVCLAAGCLPVCDVQ